MTLRAGRRGTRWGVSTAVLGAALIGCLDLSTDPNAPFALEFEGIAYPSVLAQDTLRDALGAATPLRAVALNSDFDEIAAAPISYLSLDTGVTISATGILTTTRRTGSVRVVAAVGGLQSSSRTIIVSRRPDTTFTEQDSLVQFAYALPDVGTNTTPELRLRLQTTDTVGGLTANVPGWVVRWRAVHAGDTLAPGDTSLVTLLSGGGMRSALDTTTAEGTSVRKLRVWAGRLVASVDSFVVVAEVKLHGVVVPGSPVRFVVRIAPAVAP